MMRSNTTPYDASINDFESVSGKEVAFVEGETSKTVSVNTYADSELEADEYYYLDLYLIYYPPICPQQ